jgi:hypothetical protein
MGNFYTNLVLVSADADRVVASLESHGRTAYVARSEGMTFVYDEQCEKQDPDEITRLAKLISREVGAPVLGSLNHDDDVLWLTLAERGSAINVYNSYPGFGGPEFPKPEMRDVSRLCAAFGVADRVADVEALLMAPHDQFNLEVIRHERLLELLGVPLIGLTGFNYVYEDGLPEPGVTVRTIGGAPPPPDDDEGVGAPVVSGVAPPGGVDEIHDKRVLMTALMLGQARIPAGVEPILPEGSVGGFAAFQAVQGYIGGKGLITVLPEGMRVRADDVLKRLLGVDEFPLEDTMRLVVERLDVWSSLSSEQAAAVRSGGPELEKNLGVIRKGMQQFLSGLFKR